MSITITPQIKAVGNKFGTSARKLIMPLAAAGIMATGAVSCNSSTQKDVEETPKTELELAKENVKDLEKQVKKDSIDFAQADSIKAKQNLANLKELTKDLPVEKADDILVLEAMDAYLNPEDSRSESRGKEVEAAKIAKEKLATAQAKVDIATGNVLKNTKAKLQAAKDKVKEIEANQAKSAKMDSIMTELDKFE